MQKLSMRKNVSQILTLLFAFSAISLAPSAAALSCPDSWSFPLTPGQTILIDRNTDLASYAETTYADLSTIKISLDMDIQHLVIKNFSFPLPTPYIEKISEGGRDISVTGEWKRSADGKNWQGLAAVRGDLMPYEQPTIFGSETKEYPRAKVDRILSVTDASRSGFTPNTKVAFEIKVDVKGCKQKVFYERLSIIPNYSVPVKSLDASIEEYYRLKPSAKKLNFIAQQSCNETLNTFVSHIKEESKKNQTWAIKNTKRGILDFGWSLTSAENLICWGGGELPNFDIRVAPSSGDSCLTLTTPYTSYYSYRTIKYPCSVSVDLWGGGAGSFEVARFEISAPKASVNPQSTKKTILCVKGKVIKKVSGIDPRCPKGYKKK
jgi:hypothetical protein